LESRELCGPEIRMKEKEIEKYHVPPPPPNGRPQRQIPAWRAASEEPARTACSLSVARGVVNRDRTARYTAPSLEHSQRGGERERVM
jgi:hypothetical protein